jgi:hypothetical protein
MIRTGISFALSCLFLIGLSINAFADDQGFNDKGSGSSKEDQIEKTLKEINAKLDRINFAERRIELQSIELKDLRQRLEALERKTGEALARLEDKLDKSTPPNSRISNSYVPPQTGKLNLINSWDSSVTYYINGKPYFVPARQSSTIEQPSGLYDLDIVAEGFGTIDSRRSQLLRAGESLDLRVYRR